VTERRGRRSALAGAGIVIDEQDES